MYFSRIRAAIDQFPGYQTPQHFCLTTKVACSIRMNYFFTKHVELEYDMNLIVNVIPADW